MCGSSNTGTAAAPAEIKRKRLPRRGTPSANQPKKERIGDTIKISFTVMTGASSGERGRTSLMELAVKEATVSGSGM